MALTQVLNDIVPHDFEGLGEMERFNVIVELYERFTEEPTFSELKEAMNKPYFFSVFCAKTIFFQALGIDVKEKFQQITEMDFNPSTIANTVVERLIHCNIAEEKFPAGISSCVGRAVAVLMPFVSNDNEQLAKNLIDVLIT